MRWLLLALLLCVGAVAARAAEPVAPSGLVIEPARVDLGSVPEGTKAATTLLLRNTGNSVISISRVETSCGCTTAEPDSRVLEPGAFTQLRVRVDTMGKRGRVKKSVTVVDDRGHRAEALLVLAVRANPHLKMNTGQSIFAPKCATCHAAPARGKRRGTEIYAAVCVMCHGEKGKGGYAPSLRGHDVAYLKRVLYHGSGRHMPAFYEGKGGPLTVRQIRALSNWLAGME
ncbi:MAG TPA: DUF1573 domain-containing protein [Mariprofundaceae bacterium]|nr:DUF1573 domain-containing protein [Mariprofundaceae bacterium]